MFHLDYSTAHEWMSDRYYIPVYALVIYALHIHYLSDYMSKVEKPHYLVKKVKVVWDSLLCIGSAYGAYNLVPLLISELSTKGFTGEVCTSSIQSSNPVLYFFMLSKFFELFDTTLIILGKKKLIFLHWYHHMATLMYCWDGYVHQNTGGAIFTGMNLCVHTIMYGYYAATYFGRLPNFLRAVITSLQLVQMVIGTATTITHLQCTSASPAQHTNSLWALAMYCSYFLLFGKLFIDSYIIKKKKVA